MPATLTLRGAKKLEKKLKRLETKLAKKIVRKSVREGAKVIHKRAKSNATVVVTGGLGTLFKKALVIRAWRKQVRGSYGMSVGFNTKKYPELIGYTAGSQSSIATKKFTKGSGRKHFLPAALEYGHVGPGKADSGAPKVTRPRAFMRPAYDYERQTAIRVIETKLWDGIKEAVR